MNYANETMFLTHIIHVTCHMAVRFIPLMLTGKIILGTEGLLWKSSELAN